MLHSCFRTSLRSLCKQRWCPAWCGPSLSSRALYWWSCPKRAGAGGRVTSATWSPVDVAVGRRPRAPLQLGRVAPATRRLLSTPSPSVAPPMAAAAVVAAKSTTVAAAAATAGAAVGVPAVRGGSKLTGPAQPPPKGPRDSPPTSRTTLPPTERDRPCPPQRSRGRRPASVRATHCNSTSSLLHEYTFEGRVST